MRNKSYIFGAGVLFIAALMVLSSVVVVANTVDYELEEPTATRDTKIVKNTEEIVYENIISLASRGVKCYGCNLHNDPDYNLVWFDSETPGTFNDISDLGSDNFLSGGCFVGDTWWVCEYSDTLNSNVYTADKFTGDLTLVGASGVGLNGLAYDPSTDTLYGCDSTDLHIINQANGDASPIGPFGTGGLMIGIACDMNGKLYGEDLGTDSLYEINTADGSATLIGALGIDLNYAQDIAYDKVNDVLYSTGYKGSGFGGGAFGTLDLTDGHYTLIGDFPIGRLGVPSEVDALAIPYTAENQPPGAPTIDGPSSGEPGTAYDYKFNAVDPEGDDVKYHINWGDGNVDETGLNPSGTDVTESHSWSSSGHFIIEAYAEDEYGHIGPKTTFTVTMPKAKTIPGLVQRILERYPNAFPILKNLLGL